MMQCSKYSLLFHAPASDRPLIQITDSQITYDLFRLDSSTRRKPSKSRDGLLLGAALRNTPKLFGIIDHHNNYFAWQ